MIYLIGGPPRCGKTILTEKLSYKLRVPFISVDSLEVLLTNQISNEELRKNFPKSYLTGSIDKIYEKKSSKQIMKSYIEEGQYVSSLMIRMIEKIIWDNHTYIFEGYHLSPDFVNQVIEKFPKEEIKSIFLIKSDIKKLVDDINQCSRTSNWILEQTKTNKTHIKIAEMICNYGKIFQDKAKKYNYKVLNMDENFDNQIEEAISYLSSA